MFFNPNKKYLAMLKDLGFPTNKGWWSKYPERALGEMYKMSQGTNAIARAVGSKMVWKESIVTNFGTRYDLSIETDGYPFKAPKVFVTNKRVSKGHKTHVNADGSLCLQHSSDYNSSTSVLQIRNRACAWCFAYEGYLATGKWPAAQH